MCEFEATAVFFGVGPAAEDFKETSYYGIALFFLRASYEKGLVPGLGFEKAGSASGDGEGGFEGAVVVDLFLEGGGKDGELIGEEVVLAEGLEKGGVRVLEGVGLPSGESVLNLLAIEGEEVVAVLDGGRFEGECGVANVGESVFAGKNFGDAEPSASGRVLVGLSGTGCELEVDLLLVPVGIFSEVHP